MKLLLENWRRYVNEDDKFSGNCGMFAIALGEEAIKRLVRTQTNWSVTCEEYAEKAIRFLDKIGEQNETPT